MKNLTRRELFHELFSKELLNGLVGAYNGFKDGMDKANELSCEEAGHLLGRRARKGFEEYFGKTLRKEG